MYGAVHFAVTTYAPFKLAAVRQSHSLQLSTSYCSALSLAARMTALGLFRLCTKERVKHTNNPSSKRSMNVFQRGTTRQSNEKPYPGARYLWFSAIFPQLKTIFHLIPENVRVLSCGLPVSSNNGECQRQKKTCLTSHIVYEDKPHSLLRSHSLCRSRKPNSI